MSDVSKLLTLVEDKQIVPFLKHQAQKTLVKNNLKRHALYTLEDIIVGESIRATRFPAHKQQRFTFLVPDFGLSSGGHMTIFRIMKHLEDQGFRTRVFIFNNTTYFDKQYVQYRINRYYTQLKCEIALTAEEFRSQGIEENEKLVASSWTTAYFLNKLNQDGEQKYYLVQDYEPFFYPLSTEYYLAENSYRLGFKHICASSWLSEKIRVEHKAETSYFNLGFDETVYRKHTRQKRKSILFYARSITARRGYELGSLALSLVKKQMSDVSVEIFGWSHNPALSFPYTDHGVLTHAQLADLYQRSTIGLSLSLTNVSLIPVEMMACGLPVVELNHPSIMNNFKHEVHLLAADPTPESIAQNLLRLLNDEDLREKIAEQGQQKVAAEYRWQNAFSDIDKALIGRN